MVEGALPGTPAAPVEITAGGSIYKDASGAWRGRIDVDFPDVVFTTDGKPVTVSGYEMHGYEEALYPKGTEPVWQQYGGSDTSTITRIDLPQGVWYVMKVRAVGGEWSSTFRVQTTHDTTAPPQPTKPTASVFLGAVTVKWDKKAVTGDMPADFEAAILCVGTEPSPGLDKAVTRFDLHESIFVITGASYYAPVYIRLIAVDQSGNLSPWSEQVTAMTKPLVDADIILGELDAAKTRIVNAGKIMLQEGQNLSQKLQEADTAIGNTRKALEGPGGLTERLTGAETKLSDVGALTLADGTTLNKKLTDNATAITNTQTSLTGPGGLASRITGAETKLADVGALTYATGQTLRQKLSAADTAITTAQGQVDTLKNTTLPKLNTDLTAATGRLTTAEGKLTTAQTDLTVAKTDIAAAKKSITDNKTVMDGAVTRLTTAEGEITGAKTRLVTAEGKLTTLANTTLPGLTTELNAAQGRIDSAQTAINLIPGDIASAKAAAIAAAVADAEAKDRAALATAAADAQTKAAAAQKAATEAAAADATKKAADAQAAAATDAQTKATKALNDAKTDATSKANAAQAAAITAAAADATAKAEAAEAAAATEAARLAKVASDAAEAASLAAAKAYADAQADGAGGLALEAAKADATAKANAAKEAAISAAALDATAKKEDAERVAALDAKTKADKALADAKVDAQAKATAAQTAATTAAAADAAQKTAAALATAATDAQTKATKALNDAKTDATTKADTALAYALGSAARGNNVVVNGSFDQDFTGWTKEVTQDATNYGIDTTTSRTGGRSLWTTGKGGFQQQGVPAVAGQTWEIAFWYKTESTFVSGAGGLRLQAVVNGAWADVASSTIALNTGWTRSFVRYVVPVGVTQIRPRFAFNYTGGAKTWVDDVELVNITAELAAAADATAKATAAQSAASQDATNKANAARAAADRAMAAAINVVPDPNIDQTNVWDLTVSPRLSYSTVEKYSGLRSLQITAGSGTVSVILGPTPIPVKPGQIWRVSAMRKTTDDYNGTGNNGKLRVGSSTGSLINAVAWNPSATWTEVGFDVKIPDGVTGITVGASADHTVGTLWLDDFVVSNVTDARAAAVAAEKARVDAVAAAAADATTKADKALADAKTDATSKANAAQTAAIAAADTAAKASAKAAAELVESRVATAAAADATKKATDAQTAALAAAKTYADAQADGASGAALEAAKLDATTKANAAKQAAIEAAALDATAKQEEAEANAAADAEVKANAALAAAKIDAKNKADAALADAKTDATSKAEAARKAAVDAAATDAQTKANTAKQAAIDAAATTAQSKVDTAKAATLTTAAADAKTKADEAQRLATVAAAAETLLKANGAKADAIAAAAADAKTKADTAQRLATEAAATDATAKATKALADATTAAASIATEKANAAQAAAILASGLDASFKADEAEKRAKAVAATAQSAADKAIADALAAAGLAGTKGKTLIQSAAPGAEDRNKMTLWIDTTGGANTPKQWTTGTTWAAVTDKVAVDAASVAAKAVTDASTAAGAAQTAQSTADAAMAAAGSKATILYSTTNPTGIAAVDTLWRKTDSAGDVIGEWRYTGGTTPWQSQLVRTEMISNLDVGKLTAGTAIMQSAVAQKIAAATATFQKADIGNLTVTGDSLLNNVVAQKIAAGTAQFLSLTTDQLVAGTANLGTAVAQKIAAATASFQKADISNLTAGTANMTTAVIEKLVANTAKFQTVTVDNITATATANLNDVVAQRIAAGTASFQTVDAKNLFVTGISSLSEVVAKRLAAETAEFINLSVDQLVVTGTGKFKDAVANKMFVDIFAANKISTQHMLVGNFSNLLENGSFEYGNQGWGAAANYTFEKTGGRQTPGVLKFTGTAERSFGPTSNINISVDTGDTYRLSGWAKTTAAAGAVAEVCWYWYAADGTFIGNNNVFARDMKAADGWVPLTGQKAPPEGAAYLRIRVVGTLPKVTDQLFFDDISVALAADASLIVDGAVTAKSITASEEMSAKVGQFLTLGVEQLTVTGTANMATAVADRMFTNLFSTRKLMANQVYIGEGGNLFPADMMDSGWDTSADLINQYPDSGRDGGSSMVIEASANQVGTYFALSVKDRARAPRLLPGQKYRISAFVRGNAAIPVNGVRLYVRLFKLNSTSTSGYTWASPSSMANEVAIPANTWDKVEAFFTVPEGTDVVAVVGIYSEKGTNTNVRFSDIVIQEAITPELIVNGAIIAKHITASEEMGAKLARFIKLEVTDLVASGTAKINDAVITKLFTETFATNKLTAGQVLIGMPGNILPDIGHNEPVMLAARNAASTMTVTLSSDKDYALAPSATSNTYFRPLGVAQTAAAAKDWVPVQPGQIWRWGLTVSTMRAAGSMGFVGRTLDGAAYANPPAARTVVNVGAGAYVYEAEIPANCAWICPEFILPAGTAATWIKQGSMFMYQVIDNALIVDGAITTKKLTVTAEMTAELLKAKKVEAIEIDANSLRADVGFIGILRTGILSADVVTSTHIKSDSITTELLKSDAITSKHTLTGPLIRTAVSGARTEINTQGLRVLNASNVELVRLGYGIATGMSIRNPVNGVMAPLSNMVFGAEYYTTTVPINYEANTSFTVEAPHMVEYSFRYLPRTTSAAFEYTAVSESALLMWEATVSIWNTNAKLTPEDLEYVPFELGMNILNVIGTGPPGSLIDIGNFGRYVTGWAHTRAGSPDGGNGPAQGMSVVTGMTPGSKYKVPVYLKAPNYQWGLAAGGPLNVRVSNVRLVIIPR